MPVNAQKSSENLILGPSSGEETISRVLAATSDPTLFLNYGRTNVAGRNFLFGARYYF